MPKKSACPFCKKDVTGESGGIKCDLCKAWHHYDCLSHAQNIPGLTQPFQERAAKKPDVPFTCTSCNPDSSNLLQQLFNAQLFSWDEVKGEGWEEFIVEEIRSQSAVSDAVSSSHASSSSIDKLIAFMEGERKERIEKEERDRKERIEKEERDRKERLEREERERAERETERTNSTQRIDDLIRLLSERTSNVPSTPANPQTFQNNPVSSKSASVKLPKYQLPTFSGNSMEWFSFWDAFKTAVHDNGEVAPEAKLQYLSNVLKGSAAAVIKGLPHTAANYTVAVELLKERFGRKKDIVHRLMLSVRSLPSLRSDNSNLEEFSQQVELTFRQLESLGVTDFSSFYPEIYAKLSHKMMDSFDLQMEHVGVQQPNLDNLRAFVRAEVSRMTRHRELRPGREPPRVTADKPFMSSLVSDQQQPEKEVQRNNFCVYCTSEGDHKSYYCKVVPDMQSRFEKLKEKNLCFRCLSHIPHRCPGVTCWHCESRRHHPSLCPKRFAANQLTNSINSSEAKQGVTSKSGCKPAGDVELVSNSAQEETGSQVYMLAVKGTLEKGTGSETVDVNIILDTGSKHSYILDSIANKLNCSSMNQPFEVSVAHFGSGDLKTYQTKRVKFSLQTCSGPNLQLSANVISKITAPLITQRINLPPTLLSLLRGQVVHNISSEIPTPYTVGLLVGADHFNEVVFATQSLTPNLALYHTVLGSLIFGRSCKVEKIVQSPSVASPALTINGLASPDDVLSQMWELETLGIKDDPHTSDDDLAMQQFQESVQLVDNRYHVNWPWKNLSEPLPDNYVLARERLKRFHSGKLMKSPELLDSYDKNFQSQLELGIIEKVSADEVLMPKHTVHYIPHHAVIRESSKTTKLRVVCDASAKTPHGTSLNQHLLRGPVLLANLIGLLIRFRLWAYVMVSDIEKAFLQVALHISQRDVCRFIWLKNPKLPHSKQNQQIFRFCRVPFGVIASPFLLAATIQHHLNSKNSAIANDIKRNIYVDNIFFGANSEEETIEIYKEAKGIFSDASMNLREWTTNSTKLLESLPLADKGPTDSVSVLGQKWNVPEDCLEIKGAGSFPIIATKRNLLHGMAKIFDPLGLLSPLLLPAKFLFQDLCSENIDWDVAIPESFQERWADAFKYISGVSSFSQPRRLFSAPLKYPELVCFVDASSKAYAACVYLKDGETASLLCSKSRVSPLKAPSLPRLELLAVLIGVRLLNFVKKELPIAINSCHLFSDSQIVLSWVTSLKRRTVFVENRLAEIRRHEDINFHYVPTKENPADIPTRGAQIDELSNLWWGGPDWITQTSDSWNKWEMITDNDCEVVKSKLKSDTLETTLLTEVSPPANTPCNLDPESSSTFHKLLVRTAIMKRAIHNFKSPRNRRRPHRKIVEAEEMKEARQLWEMYVQRSVFSEHFKSSTELRSTDLVRSLKLFLDADGLVRSQGRLENAEHSYDTNCPILLPKNHPVTKLIISDVHVDLLHSGVNQVLTHLRLRYWVPNGRQLVKKVLSECLNCRRTVGKSFRPPLLPALPESRVKQSAAFSHVGVDLAGPMYLKNNKRVYIYVFTCMACRAVHFELVPNKDAAHFLAAFSRFCSRRGVPVQIVSDNAPTFRLARRYLQFSWKKETNTNSLVFTNNTVSSAPDWYFIPPASPWMGGFYERMVGLLKRCLQKNLPRSSLDWYQFYTFVIAIEGMVNTRPLTYVGSSIQDGRALTPADLIAPSNRLMAVSDTKAIGLTANWTADNVTLLWKRSHCALNEFWKRWSTEYLLSLREYNLKMPRSFVKHVPRKPEVGEIVMVKDPALPRACWKLAEVSELCKGTDKNIRSAVVTFPTGQQLHRPITKLIPLEFSSSVAGSVLEKESCS